MLARRTGNSRPASFIYIVTLKLARVTGDPSQQTNKLAGGREQDKNTEVGIKSACTCFFSDRKTGKASLPIWKGGETAGCARSGSRESCRATSLGPETINVHWQESAELGDVSPTAPWMWERNRLD